MLDFHISTFEVDATPPVGHPLCGGWIKPVEAVDDPLLLRGIVLQGAGLPIVIAAVDWCGLMNESHRLWVEQLAEAAKTTADRVTLHTVHQHNAPFADHDANRLLEKSGSPILAFDQPFFDQLVRRSAEALRGSLAGGVPIDRVLSGAAEVKQVACNRRVIGPDGKLKFSRTSATKDPAARAEPEGTIDPLVRSIGFARGDRVVARAYFYATHPMSYYGDGRVSSDFVGLARGQRDQDEPGVFHLYFTGCAGNVTAGKYNDGSPENRAVLTRRMADGMAEADRKADPHPLARIEWATHPLRFEKRDDLDPNRLAAIVADPKASTVDRNRSALTWASVRRFESGRPILLSRLDLGAAMGLFLPAESFVEYQIEASSHVPDTLLATAAYGDDGPWYIPLRKSFDEGGYEPSVAFTSRETEPVYRAAIEGLLKQPRA